MPKIVDLDYMDKLQDLAEQVEANKLYNRYLTKELRKKVPHVNWTFNITRDEDGYIQSLSATGDNDAKRTFTIKRDDDMRIKQIVMEVS